MSRQRWRDRFTAARVMTAAGVGAVLLVLTALVARPITALRRLRGADPRVIMGPNPLISLKYWSAALRDRGYDSRTYVFHVSILHRREDFDTVRDTLLGSRRLFLLVGPYLVLAWALLRIDVFIAFLDGGFLRWTPLWRLEGPVLRIAGKKQILSPYGGDVAVPGHLGAWEERLLEDYPYFVEAREFTKRRVDHYSRWATLVVRNYQPGYLPRSDVLWVTQLAIDTDEWTGDRAEAGDRGGGGEVVVVHAPNHRLVKGTDALLTAVEELRAEGVPIRLSLLERRPNEEVREAIRTADVVADQFVVGYAMFAIEGLSAGKPVLSALSGMPPEARRARAMRECPIVDTDLDNLKQNLSRLVDSKDERVRIGRASRRFALDHHSLDAVGRTWELVLDHVWRGAPLPAELPPYASTDARGGSQPGPRPAEPVAGPGAGSAARRRG